jgi:hypothetical protein
VGFFLQEVPMIYGKWVLFLIMTMLAKEPASHEQGYTDFLPVIAESFAEEASARPLPGMTPGLTASLDVIMAWHESRFNSTALHDHGAGYGLFGTHAATWGAPIPIDVPGQVWAWHELAKMSFKICSERPLSEKLGWYMWGGEGCEKRLGMSRSRVYEAERLLRENPPFGP